MSTLVTKVPRDFKAVAVTGEHKFDEEFKLSSLRGKYVVLSFTAGILSSCVRRRLSHSTRSMTTSERRIAR